MKGQEMKTSQLIDIQEHCFKLGELLSALHQFEYLVAIDWLDIAAGVESVKVTTAKHDSSLMFCGEAADYQDKRSELLSNLATRLTIFNFVWGSFESVAKVLMNQQKGSIVNKSIRFLKQNYSPRSPIAFYEDSLHTLRELIEDNGSYEVDCQDFELNDLADLNGLGLHVVRKIRNDLAHGSAQLPMPDDWGSEKTDLLPSEHRHLDLIDTCTRIILLTVQMLLLGHVRGKGIIVECLLDEDGIEQESTAEHALHVIHLQPDPINSDQLFLFNEDAFA